MSSGARLTDREYFQKRQVKFNASYFASGLVLLNLHLVACLEASFILNGITSGYESLAHRLQVRLSKIFVYLSRESQFI